MDFYINTTTFREYLLLASKVATRHIYSDQKEGVMIKLYAYPNLLEIEMNGICDIIVTIRQSQGYIYRSMGKAYVLADELLPALNSFCYVDEVHLFIRDGMLKLSPSCDEYDYIKIPRHPYPKEYPPVSVQYNQESTINREYFLRGLKIKYACYHIPPRDFYGVGFEAINNTLKFGADGRRYNAIVEYVGGYKAITTNELKASIGVSDIPTIIQVFEKDPCSYLEFKLLEKPFANILPHLLIKSDHVKLCIHGCTRCFDFRKTHKVLKYSYTYQIPAKVTDWECIANALTSSKYSFLPFTYLAKITTDLPQGYIEIQSNSCVRMNRKVPFVLDTCVYDLANDKTRKPWFSCSALFLIDMINNNKRKNTVTMYFEDQTYADEYFSPPPVLFKFADETDQNGVTEKSLVFFDVSVAWDDKYLSRECESIRYRAEILDL
ncbi:MAG: hypothetical protein ABFD79_16215 [Phycisphaerales bacterium]